MTTSKPIDKSRGGYSIRQHESGVYQVFFGRVTKCSPPQYTTHELTRARNWIDTRLGLRKPDTVSHTERERRGQAQMGLRGMTVDERDRINAAIARLKSDGETNAQVILRALEKMR